MELLQLSDPLLGVKIHEPKKAIATIIGTTPTTGEQIEVAEGANGFFYVLFGGLFSAPFWTKDEAIKLANHLIIGLQDPKKLHWNLI